MACSQEDSAGGFPLADDMAGGGCGEDAILADDELLDAVCRANLGDVLNDFGIPVASVDADDKSRIDCGNMSARWGWSDGKALRLPTLSSLGNGEENACHK